MSSSQIPQGIWVVGSTFGVHYARALKDHGLSAIIGRGGEKGRRLAQALGCDYFSRVDQALTHSRPECAVVVVRSSIVGGEGDDIVRSLLLAGIPVLQEMPIHPLEMVNSLRVAQLQGVRFDVTPFYDQMPTVRRFLRAANRLALESPLRSVEMRVSVQTLHCALMVLSEVLGAPSPSVTTAPMASPEKILIGSTWQGIVADIVVMNRLDAASPDDNSQPLMQITLLCDEGELMLHAPFGQVIWESRLQQPMSSGMIDDSENGLTDETLFLTSRQPEPIDIKHIYRDMASGIRATLQRFIAPEGNGSVRLQRQLAVLQLWQTICSRIGYPQQRSLAPPLAIGNRLGLTDHEEER